MSTFTEALVENDADSLEQEVLELIEGQFAGWEPAESALATWLIKAFTRISSSVREQAAETSAAMFKKFGETIANVPPILAAPASATSTWTMIDNAGYTIPAGTQVSIASSGDSAEAFEVVSDVVIEPGATATTAGQVVLRAVIPGTAANGLSAAPVPLDSNATTSAVESIALISDTSGGVDEEDEDAYLSRLTEELQLLSLSLIVPRDFEIDARSVPGVARALCVPGYKPLDKSEGNPLILTVFAVDAAGAPLATLTKDALEERQQAKIPDGTEVFVEDPTYTKIDVRVEVTAISGFDPATVEAAVLARLAEYLAPANWGLPTTGDSSGSAGWVNATKVYFNELISEADRVPGVGRVVTLLVGGGTGKTFTVAAATDKFTSTAHGFSSGDAIIFRTGLVPGAPLAANTVYYVRDVETNAFKVTTTVGGAALNITSDGSGTAVKMATADITLAGVAPLAEPGNLAATVA